MSKYRRCQTDGCGRKQVDEDGHCIQHSGNYIQREVHDYIVFIDKRSGKKWRLVGQQKQTVGVCMSNLCFKIVQNGSGFCKSHGPRCEVTQCNSGVAKDSRCYSHHPYFQCSMDGCRNIRLLRGPRFCTRHSSQSARAKRSQSTVEYRRNNVQARIASCIRTRIRRAFKRNGVHKKRRTIKLLGCSFAELRKYVENMFKPGMSWANYGNGENQWSLDHIVPVSAFDLTRDEEKRKCFQYCNLQPLWHLENLRKSDRICEEWRNVNLARELGVDVH